MVTSCCLLCLKFIPTVNSNSEDIISENQVSFKKNYKLKTEKRNGENEKQRF